MENKVEEFKISESEESSQEENTESNASITSLSEILTRVQKKGWKPKISHLSDAIVDGKFTLTKGARVIIEYTKDPYRDTSCWVVVAVFDEVPPGSTISPGHVRLYDPEKTNFGCTNYKDVEKYGLIMKIPDGSRRWIQGEEETLMQLAKRRKRKRQLVHDEIEENVKPSQILSEKKKPKESKEPKKLKEPKKEKPVKVILPQVPGEKKKRGRPPGSKNKATLARESVKTPNRA